jgi:hypothetical protein
LYSVALDPTLITIEYLALSLGAIFALAAVPAISERVTPANVGWARWATNLAMLGFGVTAINNLRLLAVMPDRAAVLAVGDEVTRKAIVYSQFTLDPNGWLGYGAVGIWVLVISILALRADALPKLLNYVGIAVAIAYWCATLASVNGLSMFGTIAAGLGALILAPIWYIWIGFQLRQASH